MAQVWIAKLGDFNFGIDTAAFEGLDRTSEYRWVSKDRLGRPPARQYMGPGSEKITLKGVIYPRWKGGLGQVNAMRALAGKGEALPFFYTDEKISQNMGLWTIDAITEGRSFFTKDGAPLKIEFNLSLSAYGEDRFGRY